MAQNDATDDALVAEQYQPVYKFDPDDGPLGSVVSTVSLDDQIEALRTIQGDGPVEPDGWMEDDPESVPILNGVPITVIATQNPVNAGKQGTERTQVYAVRDIGRVRVFRAGRHPTNVSKIEVEPAADEED